VYACALPYPTNREVKPATRDAEADSMQELPSDPWQSPLMGVIRRDPGQSAKAQATMLRERRVGEAGRDRDESLSWEKGADGERLVGNLLDWSLDPLRWLVLHDLRITPNGANVDHLVIGPPGVFTINTKNHKGRHVWVSKRAVWVAGHPTDYLKKARWEAQEVRRHLKERIPGDVPVTPVLAIITDRLTVRGLPDDVGVAAAQHLDEWVTSHVRRLRNIETVLLQHAAGDWARSMAMSA
jgi:hypothetical protein